jgi:RNA polymerase sigma-70 factor (ECF subfamily)
MENSNALMTAVYEELRRIAGAQLGDRTSGQTLQPTALVNEAYLALAGHPDLPNGSRQEFLRFACRVMRNLIVDHARAREAAKRGGGWQRITLSSVADDKDQQFDVLALNEALIELTEMSERMGRLVELRFFCGLDESEAAQVMGVSRASSTRDWRRARAWLAHKLHSQEPGE